MEKKVTRGRKPKVQISQPIINEELVNEVVQEPLAPNTQPEQSVAYMYKCIECGNVQLVKRCQRCSSHLVRPI